MEMDMTSRHNKNRSTAQLLKPETESLKVTTAIKKGDTIETIVQNHKIMDRVF